MVATALAQCVTRCHFCGNVFTLIQSWLRKSMVSNVWDEITYPFRNFNDCTFGITVNNFGKKKRNGRILQLVSGNTNMIFIIDFRPGLLSFWFLGHLLSHTYFQYRVISSEYLQTEAGEMWRQVTVVKQTKWWYISPVVTQEFQNSPSVIFISFAPQPHQKSIAMWTRLSLAVVVVTMIGCTQGKGGDYYWGHSVSIETP